MSRTFYPDPPITPVRSTSRHSGGMRAHRRLVLRMLELRRTLTDEDISQAGPRAQPTAFKGKPGISGPSKKGGNLPAVFKAVEAWVDFADAIDHHQFSEAEEPYFYLIRYLGK